MVVRRTERGGEWCHSNECVCRNRERLQTFLSLPYNCIHHAHNMGQARTRGRREAQPCVFASVVSRSALSARDAAPGNSCPRVRTEPVQCAHTPTDPPCFDPAWWWCGVFWSSPSWSTRRHGPQHLSFTVGHELPVPGDPTKEPRVFPSAARPSFLARLGAVQRGVTLVVVKTQG